MSEENNNQPPKNITQGLWMTTPTGALVNITQVVYFAKIEGDDAKYRFRVEDGNSVVLAKVSTGEEIPAIVASKEICDQCVSHMAGYLSSLTYGAPEEGGSEEGGGSGE